MPKPEETVRALPDFLHWRPWPHGDPIDMEFVIAQVDPVLRPQLIVTRLETVASVYGGIAEGARKAAGIVRGGKG